MPNLCTNFSAYQTQKTVFDVSGKDVYAKGGSYHGDHPNSRDYLRTQITLTIPKVFAGKEPNRALGLSSLKEKDCVADYESLSEKEQGVLNDWYTFFSKRYNIIGQLADDSGSKI